jgi:hypothetical protein
MLTTQLPNDEKPTIDVLAVLNADIEERTANPSTLVAPLSYNVAHTTVVINALNGQSRPSSAELADIITVQKQFVERAEKAFNNARATAVDILAGDNANKTAITNLPKLELAVERETNALKGLEKLKKDKDAARPAALKEAETAITERDALAAELGEKYPQLVAYLADLFSRVRENEVKLLKVRATGEATGVDLRSAESVARGQNLPIIVVGKDPHSARLADVVKLPSLRVGDVAWMGSQTYTTNRDAVPLKMIVTNHGQGGTFVYLSNGSQKDIKPGDTTTVEFLAGGLSILDHPGILVTA